LRRVWGWSDGKLLADMNNDGVVDGIDYALLGQGFGK
jgi:hypothetical protein